MINLNFNRCDYLAHSEPKSPLNTDLKKLVYSRINSAVWVRPCADENHGLAPIALHKAATAAQSAVRGADRCGSMCQVTELAPPLSPLTFLEPS